MERVKLNTNKPGSNLEASEERVSRNLRVSLGTKAVLTENKKKIIDRYFEFNNAVASIILRKTEIRNKYEKKIESDSGFALRDCSKLKKGNTGIKILKKQILLRRKMLKSLRDRGIKEETKHTKYKEIAKKLNASECILRAVFERMKKSLAKKELLEGESQKKYTYDMASISVVYESLKLSAFLLECRKKIEDVVKLDLARLAEVDEVGGGAKEGSEHKALLDSILEETQGLEKELKEFKKNMYSLLKRACIIKAMVPLILVGLMGLFIFMS